MVDITTPKGQPIFGKRPVRYGIVMHYIDHTGQSVCG